MVKIRNDLSGQQFGYWSVLKLNHSNNGNQYWLCRCKCGKEKSVYESSLMLLKSKSCGCLLKEIKNKNAINLNGKTFGFLVVKEFSHKKKKIKYWLCKCFCGRERAISQLDLVYNRTDSCGCKGRERRKATFLKKYGSENPFGSKIIQNKIKKTNLNKYGVEYPQQNAKSALKTAKTINNSVILYNWKTEEEIVCIGSYEKKAIEYLNKNQIEYGWQLKAFKTPFLSKTGINKTYRPDLYLIKEDKWIEIKGYFRDDAEEKWNWFHKEYPNSELWDKKKLQEMKIL